MLKKYKITLPDCEEIFVIQTEKPDISAKYKTTIMVDGKEYEYDEEYDESDVDIEELDVNFDDLKYLNIKALKEFITKPFDIKHTVTFQATVLKKAIEQNIDFAHKDSMRYNINGVHFNFEENDVCVVATNGHALSFIKIPNIYGFAGKITIPLPVVYAMLDYANVNQDVVLGLSEDLKQINFCEKNFKLIDAEFPDYKRVIPEKFDLVAKIPTKEFLNLLNNYGDKADDKAGVLLKFSNNTLLLEKDKIDCEFKVSFDVKLNIHYLKNIMMNIHYLKNIMKQINGSKFLLQTNGSHSPCCVQEVADTNKKYIIMPMII
jgi:DNA polymerase-3 subunit beta